MPKESSLYFLGISARTIPAILFLGPDLPIFYNKRIFLPLGSIEHEDLLLNLISTVKDFFSCLPAMSF